MSTYSIQQIRDWLVSNHQWSPAQGFIGSAQVTYNAAVQFGVTDRELDQAMNMPAGTVGQYLLSHGMPPLSAPRTPLGPRATNTTPPSAVRPPTVSVPVINPGDSPYDSSPSGGGTHTSVPRGRQPGDVVTNASGTYVVQPDGTLQHVQYTAAPPPPQPTSVPGVPPPRPPRVRTPSPSPTPAPVTVHEVAPVTYDPRNPATPYRGTSTSPASTPRALSPSMAPAPPVVVSSVAPANTPASTAPVSAGGNAPFVYSAPNVSGDYASDPSMPSGGGGGSGGAGGGAAGPLGLSTNTLMIGAAAVAAALLLRRR